MRTSIPLTLALLIAACTDAAPPDPQANLADAATGPAGSLGGKDMPASTGLPTATAPGAAAVASAPELTPIVAADMRDANLTGPGCAFHHGSPDRVLLAVIDRGDGMLRIERRRQRIAAATPGRAAVQQGQAMTGDGFVAVVTRAPGSNVPQASAVTAWPATLTLRMVDGAERVYGDGRWECTT